MFRRTRVIRLFFALALLGICVSSHAITYLYQGNQFDFASSTIMTPCDPGVGLCMIDSVTVSLDFAAPLPANMALGPVTPDAWSIFDGETPIDQMTPGIATMSPLFEISVGTDGLGNIDKWLIDINPTDPDDVGMREWSGTRTRNFDGFVDDQTRYCQSLMSGSCFFQGLALVDDNPGTWSTIPLPAGFWLFGGALAALMGLRRRIHQ